MSYISLSGYKKGTVAKIPSKALIKYCTCPIEGLSIAFSVLKDLKVKWIGNDLHWSDIESDKGTFN